MAVLKGKTTRQNLLKKGFRVANGHHHFFEFYYKDKLIAKTRTSHNDQDIGEGLIDAMRKQCHVSASFFKEFAKCTKSEEDYVNELTQSGIIEKAKPESTKILKKAKPITVRKVKNHDQ